MKVGDLQKLSMKELVELHNKNVKADKRIKKFRDKDTALRRTAGALGSAAGRKKTEKTEKKEGSTEGRKRRDGVFTRAALKKIKLHRPGTKRDTAIKLLRRKNGAKIEEIMEACEWPYRTAYEGVTLLNRQLGYGLKQEGDRIYLVGEPTVKARAQA